MVEAIKRKKPINIVREKQEILLALEAAMLSKDNTLGSELKKRLSDLEELEAKETASRQSKYSLEQINDRNKTHNMITTKVQRKTSGSELDPFSRRPTQPQIWMPSTPNIVP
eukprot:TRINITY_DN6819_c0_g2_i1.p1 TRINITY_DN6819_c0_g2~~TRINITY_DN6819_c0_g2_i1.p1  ORF type:complete len:123 (-),score=23.19 TRINITY_DN6819_c0_g2_i1:3-338(-)